MWYSEGMIILIAGGELKPGKITRISLPALGAFRRKHFIRRF